VRTREIDLECWVCGERFVGKEPRSYAVGGRGSDLCPKPLDQNPLPLMLHTCPGCGFTGDGRAFHASQADEQVREWVLARGLAEAARQVPDSGYARYELAALCHGRRRRVSALQLAEYYLAASWSAQLEQAEGVAPQYQAEAAKHLERALLVGEVADEERAVMTYLVGELRRRLGEFEAALQLFDEAAIQFTQHGGPTWLLRALGQQAGLAKEGSADPAPLASSG
jgi:hypothetical protein